MKFFIYYYKGNNNELESQIESFNILIKFNSILYKLMQYLVNKIIIKA